MCVIENESKVHSVQKQIRSGNWEQSGIMKRWEGINVKLNQTPKRITDVWLPAAKAL